MRVVAFAQILNHELLRHTQSRARVIEISFRKILEFLRRVIDPVNNSWRRLANQFFFYEKSWSFCAELLTRSITHGADWQKNLFSPKNLGIFFCVIDPVNNSLYSHQQLVGCYLRLIFKAFPKKIRVDMVTKKKNSIIQGRFPNMSNRSRLISKHVQ